MIPGSARSAGEGIGYPLQCPWASLVAQLVKISLQHGRPGFDPWVGKVPWRRGKLPTPVFWPGEFHGLYSPWGHKKLDRTKRLSLSSFLVIWARLGLPWLGQLSHLGFIFCSRLSGSYSLGSNPPLQEEV